MKAICTAIALIVLPFLLVANADAQTAPESLENTSWQLVVIRGLNDSEFIPDNPRDYLLRFRLDSRLQIEADCNQAGATWTQQENDLTLTDLVSTRKFCPGVSLFNRYIMNLERVRSFRIRGKNLILQTGVGGDTMEFEPYIYVPGSQ